MTKGLRLASGLLCLAPAAAAQEITAGASRWLTSPHVFDYRLSVSRYSAGPLSFVPFGHLAMQGPSTDGAALLGLGGEVTFRLNGQAQPYLIGGASGGFLDLRSGAGLGLWGSWSAGLGAEVLRLGGMGLGLEARYHELTRFETQGLSFGLRLGAALGRGGLGTARVEPVAPLADEPRVTIEPAAPADDAAPVASGDARELSSTFERRVAVVEAATAAMGSPYKWGGNDENGFDCSGLIRHAYAVIGIELPRRSAEQAQVGFGLPLDRAELAPGDILAFSARPGGPVTHVGLYLGEGRFIHSATGGVRASRLDPDDPEGKWWHQRWVGARRVVGGTSG
ncbi:MAG: C40 family peptidase [Gemmatimonadales bacterium]